MIFKKPGCNCFQQSILAKLTKNFLTTLLKLRPCDVKIDKEIRPYGTIYDVAPGVDVVLDQNQIWKKPKTNLNTTDSYTILLLEINLRNLQLCVTVWKVRVHMHGVSQRSALFLLQSTAVYTAQRATDVEHGTLISSTTLSNRERQ